MSKLRQRDFNFAEELPPHADGVMHSYIVYTARKADAPHRYAGYLNAPDIDLAVEYACEHYGQDEVCSGIWVHLVDDLLETACSEDTIDPSTGSDGDDTESDPGWIAFTQKHRGDIHIEAGTVHAPAAEAARAKTLKERSRSHMPASRSRARNDQSAGQRPVTHVYSSPLGRAWTPAFLAAAAADGTVVGPAAQGVDRTAGPPPARRAPARLTPLRPHPCRGLCERLPVHARARAGVCLRVCGFACAFAP